MGTHACPGAPDWGRLCRAPGPSPRAGRWPLHGPRGALARSGGSVGGSTSPPRRGEGGRFPGAGGRSQAPSSVPQPCPAGRAAGPSAPPPNAACRCPLTHSPRCARATRGPTPASVLHPAPPPPPCTLPQCCVWNRWGSRLAPLGGDHVELAQKACGPVSSSLGLHPALCQETLVPKHLAGTVGVGRGGARKGPPQAVPPRATRCRPQAGSCVP